MGVMSSRSRAVPAPPPSLHTETLSTTTARGLRRAPPSPIVALGWFGRGLAPLPLAPSASRWTLGAGTADLVVPRQISTKISRHHATISRTPTGLVISDAGSKNGLAATPGGARVPHLELTASQVAWLGDLGLQALSAPALRLREQLAWRIGLTAHPRVDAELERLCADHPLLLVSPVASDAVGLAREVHAAGPRRDNPLVVGTDRAPSLDDALGGTVVLPLDTVGPLAAQYVQRLLDLRSSWRVVFIASALRVLQVQLGVPVPRLDTVTLVPLVRRREDVRGVLAAMWRELGASGSVDGLGNVVLRALDRHDWRGGLDELALVAERLLAYVTHGSARRAAAALGISHQALTAHFARLGFGAVDVGG